MSPLAPLPQSRRMRRKTCIKIVIVLAENIKVNRGIILKLILVGRGMDSQIFGSIKRTVIWIL